MFNMILDWVSGSNWSYLAIFGVAVLDAFFPVVPSESAVILAGALAGSGEGLNVFLIILVAWAGAVTGDNISYGIGKWAGERTVKRLFRSEKAIRGFDWAERQLEERGSYIILVGAIHPVRPHGRHVHVRLHEGAAVAPVLPLRPSRRRDLGRVRDHARLHRRQAVRAAAVEGRPRRARDRVLRRLRDRARPQVAGQEGAAGAVRSGSRVRIHVTGASGFLGSELLAREPGATGRRVEIRDAGAVRDLFAQLRPEVVVHTAYRQDGDGAREIVVDGSENVARAAAAVGAWLVHLSTDVVFDGRKGTPYVEDDTPSPCTDYGHAKAEAEERVAAAAPGALLVRTSLIVGGPGHAPSKHELAARNPEATFFEDEIRSPVQVGDLARALLELAALELSGPLNIAGADDLSRADLAELVTGRTVRRAPAPPGRPLDCALDSSRVRGLLSTRLRGVREVFA